MTLFTALLAAVAALPLGFQELVRTYSPAVDANQHTEHYQGQGLTVAEPRTYAALVRVDNPEHQSCGFISVNVDAPGKRGWASLFCRNMERTAGEWLPGGATQFWDFAGNPNEHHIFSWDFWKHYPKGTWHHVAIVATSRNVRYYFDGKPVSEYQLQTPFAKTDLLAEVAFNYDAHGVTAERLILDAALPAAAIKEYAEDLLCYRRYLDLLGK